jgi:hypothetical protein
MLRYRIFFDIVLNRYRMSIHSISMFSKGLSFITNRKRRNEGTFCASELAGIEPTPPAPKGAGRGMSACFQDLEHSISNVNSFDIECNIVSRYRRSFSDARYRCNIVIYRYRRSDTRYRRSARFQMLRWWRFHSTGRCFNFVESIMWYGRSWPQARRA